MTAHEISAIAEAVRQQLEPRIVLLIKEEFERRFEPLLQRVLDKKSLERIQAKIHARMSPERIEQFIIERLNLEADEFGKYCKWYQPKTYLNLKIAKEKRAKRRKKSRAARSHT